MTDRQLIVAGVLISVVTLYAVIAAADGVVTSSDANVAGAFVMGAGLAVLILTGKRPKL